jgi:O-antigen ligase
MRHLGRLLVLGYGIAAIAGIVAYLVGAGVLTVVLTVWLGGAAAVALLALAITPFLAESAVATGAEDAALADALRLWEQDRLGDRMSADEATHGSSRAAG